MTLPFLLIVGSLLAFYPIQLYMVKKLQKKNRLGNVTLILLSFIAGVALGSGNFLPTVWLPITLAFVLYEWPRLKALLTH